MVREQKYILKSLYRTTDTGTFELLDLVARHAQTFHEVSDRGPFLKRGSTNSESNPELWADVPSVLKLWVSGSRKADLS